MLTSRRSLVPPALCAWLVFLAAAWGGVGCRPTDQASAPAQPTSPDTWAVVDGREIKQEQVEKAFRRAADANQPPSAEEALTAKLNLLNDLIVQEILLAKAREAKVDVPQTELDAAYAEARKNIPDETFKRELARMNLTEADMREFLRHELVSQKMLDREVKSKVAVSDQDVTDFFNANRQQFNIAEDAYRVAQILVTPVREPQITNRTGDDASTVPAANQKVAMLMERLKGGASFAEVARDYSEDPESAPRGGDLGFMGRSALNQLPPALRNLVLNASPGTVDVVSQGGAHAIVLLVEKAAAGQRDLTTPGVREQIAETLRGRKEQLLRAAYLTMLRSDARVTNYLARQLVASQGKLPQPGQLLPSRP